MTLRQYEAFLKTVACASVSAAARELGVSQSALTQLLAGLERDCGFPLLVRNRGGVHLTPAGKALLPAVEQVCAADTHLQHRIQEVRERTGGTIRIATFKSVAVNWLPPMIKEFQAQHPEARFRLFDGAYAEVDAYVRSGTVDMGFVSLPSELPGEIVPVCSDRLLAVLPAGHPLAAQDAVPIAAFGTEPVVSLVDSTNRDALRVLDARARAPRHPLPDGGRLRHDLHGRERAGHLHRTRTRAALGQPQRRRAPARSAGAAHDRHGHPSGVGGQAARAHLRRLRAHVGAEAPVKKRNENQAAAALLR